MTKFLAFTAETIRLALRHRHAPLNLHESTYAMGVAGQRSSCATGVFSLHRVSVARKFALRVAPPSLFPLA